jgi:TetR/AcrR family transcriptional repressor of nem operon
MRVFWTRGYEAASIRHLVDRMGIQRGSLYATFRGKRALFLASIDRYDRVVTAKLLATLAEPASGLDAIRAFFRLKIELALEPGRPRGCLVTNSATELGSRDRGAANKVGAVLTRIEGAFHRALVRARDAGEIDRAHDLRALARYLTSSAQGLSVMAKTFPDRAILEDIVSVILATVSTVKQASFSISKEKSHGRDHPRDQSASRQGAGPRHEDGLPRRLSRHPRPVRDPRGHQEVLQDRAGG